MFRNGKLFAIHSDHLGTPRLMTNELNQPVWQWPYSAFGNNKPTGVLKAAPNLKAALTNVPVLLKATGATEMGLRMPGQLDDPETGTFQNIWRSYWAAHGRYVQSDPIGLVGGMNRYAYVEGNPLSFVDPRGENAIAIGGAILGGIGLGIIQMSRPKPNDGASTGSSSSGAGNDQCCSSYTDVYEANDGKHGSTQRGNISPEPSNPSLALQNSVGAGGSRIGYDGLTGQIVIFRLTRTDEPKCIKYWHGYVVHQRDLTPEQWKAGRDAGYPSWPRKPK